MNYESFLNDCESKFCNIDAHLDDLLSEMCPPSVDWTDLCDEAEEVGLELLTFAKHMRALPENERDTPHHRRVFEAAWASVVDGFQRAIDLIESDNADAAGDDEIADELRSAYDSTSYCKATNETTYPVKFGGRDTGPGTSLQTDCTTSCKGNLRIIIAACYVAAVNGVEIDDGDCDTLESAAEAIRATVADLEPT